MKPALAPTASLATPRVEAFVKNKLMPVLGESATLSKFYACEPPDSDVSSWDGKEKWVEGNWGAHVICNQFSAGDFHQISKLSETINVNDVSIRAEAGFKIELTFWISARVMR